MTPESLKIGEAPPAGDLQGRYEWMKNRQQVRRIKAELERRKKISAAKLGRPRRRDAA